MSQIGTDSDTSIALKLIEEHVEDMYTGMYIQVCSLCGYINESRSDDYIPNIELLKLHLFNEHKLNELSNFIESSKVSK